MKKKLETDNLLADLKVENLFSSPDNIKREMITIKMLSEKYIHSEETETIAINSLEIMIVTNFSKKVVWQLPLMV